MDGKRKTQPDGHDQPDADAKQKSNRMGAERKFADDG
jgi:hypothetical protein